MQDEPKYLRVLSPLQYELLAERTSIYDHIIELRKVALKKFNRVSKVYRFFNEACLPSSKDDVFLDVKLMATGLILKMNRIASVRPKSIIGFAYEMPNGKIGQMALATYPDVVIFRDNMRVEIPVRGQAAWCGLIPTFHSNNLECREHFCAAKKVCDSCIKSHELACELLDEAENQGILVEVYDATDYWMTKNPDALQQACDSLRSEFNPSEAV